MNRREQLQDRYEDALFALLMDEIGEIEGKVAIEENERLKNDPTFFIPEDVDKRCMQTIRRAFMKRRVHSVGRVTVKAMKRVALVAGIAAMLFTCAFAASPTVRVNTMNFIIEVFDTHTVFRFTEGSDDAAPQVGVGWLPEGYALESHGYSTTNTWYQYQKSEDELIHIEYALTSGAAFDVDTEDAEVSYVEIQGSQAMLAEKENGLQLVWAVKDNTAFIGLIGTGVEPKELIRVANELKY